jgi:hypothetical protein
MESSMNNLWRTISAAEKAQKSEGMAEGVRDLGYDAQSLITKLRRDVEEKRLQPTRQAVLMAARELAGDMDFAPELLVQQVLGQGVTEGFFSELDTEIGDMLDGYIAKYQDGLLDADHLGAMIDKVAARLSQQHRTDQSEMARHVSNYVADAVGEE